MRKTEKKKNQEKSGRALFNQLVKLTGIPAASVKAELKSILDRKNIDVNKLTLDQLRYIVATYLREIMCGILEGSPKKREPQH